jgi:hypothetical protein
MAKKFNSRKSRTRISRKFFKNTKTTTSLQRKVSSSRSEPKEYIGTMRKYQKQCVCGSPKPIGPYCCEKCRDDWDYIVIRRLTDEDSIEREIEIAEKYGLGPAGVCCICGGNFVWGGNSPWPVVEPRGDENPRCCARCNDEVVIPARIEKIML